MFSISLYASSLLLQNAAAKVICMIPHFSPVTPVIIFCHNLFDSFKDYMYFLKCIYLLKKVYAAKHHIIQRCYSF